MKPSIQTLGQILYSPSQYVIPVFQRNYRWEEPQWAKLWESLSEIQSPQKRGNHFMGFLVFVPGLPQPGQNTTFHLIDGQQRLCTLSILLVAIRNVARQTGQAELVGEINDYYLVHPLKKGDPHYRLLPKERDHDNYLAIVTGSDTAQGRIAEALTYFEARLTGFAADAAGLRQIFDVVCQRFEFMCATLETENAYNIFKSLNSTGVPLGPADLIRNFVFMHVAPDAHDDFDHEHWGPLEERFAKPDRTLDEERFSKFFRDYLMAEGRYVKPKETFPSFEARYEATDFSPRALARTLSAHADYYAIICGQVEDTHAAVTHALAGLNMLKSSTTYPLLLALFARRAAREITADELAQAIEMLRGFILRRFVCGASSRGYGPIFVRALAKDSGNALTTLEAYLLERGWPADPQFEAAFVEFPLYESGYAREVLVALERARGHKEPADLSAAQIEHILPQKLSDEWRAALGGAGAKRIQMEWLHRPGNLTLSAYNQALWNHPFAKKRDYYAQSNIVLTRELAKHEQWTAEEIRARGERLAHAAAQIWSGPAVERADVELDAGTKGVKELGREQLRQSFWIGLSDYISANHLDLPTFKVRKNWVVRTASGLRHIGVEMHFNLRRQRVGIDIWFWRAASVPLWKKIRRAPEAYNALVDTDWQFEQRGSKTRARMFINLPISTLRTPATWPVAYRWLAEKLALVYARVIPQLRGETGADESA